MFSSPSPSSSSSSSSSSFPSPSSSSSSSSSLSPAPVPIPVIEISLAPPEEPQPEPYSPFTPFNHSFGLSPSSSSSSSPSSSSPDRSDMDDETYRPTLLTPPVQSWTLSPLRPLSERRPQGQGLKDEEFQALLRSSKERSALAASKKTDLRKEVALRAHKNKQLERRARFLSKIGAPPSPTAVSTPKTPPDSPAIFHYSLPSPGLCSPLALFEKLGLDNQDPEERGVRKVWVEQVDFRLAKQPQSLEPDSDSDCERETVDAEMPGLVPVRKIETPSITVTTPSEREEGSSLLIEQGREPQSPQREQTYRLQKGHARKRSVPSLEEITERYSAQVVTSAAHTAAPTPTPTSARARLPAFLNARKQSPSPPLPTLTVTGPESEPEPTVRPRLACTGRIRFPSRSPSPLSPSETCKPLPDLPTESISIGTPTPRKRATALPSLPTCVPVSPISPRIPSIEVSGPDRLRLTEANLQTLKSRASTAREMLTAIRRRTVVCNGQICANVAGTPPPAAAMQWHMNVMEDEKHRRRHSAPTDLPSVAGRRTGFMHPVLALPGGF